MVFSVSNGTSLSTKSALLPDRYMEQASGRVPEAFALSWNGIGAEICLE